jgi:hypothetical protein
MIAPDNLPSTKLARKLGFEQTRLAQLPGTGEQVQLFCRNAP